MDSEQTTESNIILISPFILVHTDGDYRDEKYIPNFKNSKELSADFSDGCKATFCNLNPHRIILLLRMSTMTTDTGRTRTGTVTKRLFFSILLQVPGAAEHLYPAGNRTYRNIQFNSKFREETPAFYTDKAKDVKSFTHYTHTPLSIRKGVLLIRYTVGLREDRPR